MPQLNKNWGKLTNTCRSTLVLPEGLIFSVIINTRNVFINTKEPLNHIRDKGRSLRINLFHKGTV